MEIQNYELEWEAYINIYIVLTVENDMWFSKIGYTQGQALGQSGSYTLYTSSKNLPHFFLKVNMEKKKQ